MREKDGYTITETVFYPNDSERSTLNCYTYVAHTENPFWAGDAPLHQIAQQIARAHGPSGSNREYLFELANAMRRISPVPDEHLDQLDQLVKDILTKDDAEGNLPTK